MRSCGEQSLPRLSSAAWGLGPAARLLVAVGQAAAAEGVHQVVGGGTVRARGGQDDAAAPRQRSHVSGLGPSGEGGCCH